METSVINEMIIGRSFASASEGVTLHRDAPTVLQYVWEKITVKCFCINCMSSHTVFFKRRIDKGP